MFPRDWLPARTRLSVGSTFRQLKTLGGRASADPVVKAAYHW